MHTHIETLEEEDDNVGVGASSDPRSGGEETQEEETQEEETQEEETQEEEEDKKCEYSSEFRCIANNGTNIGESVCCGENGTILTTKYNCPNSLPYCKGYKMW